MYAYNRGGNITSYSEYAYTTGTLGAATKTVSYLYGDTNWKDKVTSIDGKAITYDAIGNPLTYDGWTLTWKAGRMLHSMVKTGTNAQFTYDHNGLRIKKVVNNVTTSYTLNGKSIVHMTQGNNDLHFFYDAQGKPAMVRFGGTDYFYVYNLQGDVVGMIDTNGTLVVEYVYDAWGAPIAKTGTLAATLGTLNPFRYRGYVYDEETGLYYLRSRYYHPVWKRFIQADAILEKGSLLLGANAFIYCYNSPVRSVDNNGLEAIALTASFSITGSPTISILADGLAPTNPVGFIVLLFSLIFSPAETANDEDEIEYRIEKLEAFGDLIDSLSTSKAKADASTKIPRQQYNVHHIVAKSSPYAKPAQMILEDVNIDYNNDPDNLVKVSTKFHWFIHNKPYYTAVNVIVSFAYGLSEDQKEENVRRSLRLIKSVIQFLDQ